MDLFERIDYIAKNVAGSRTKLAKKTDSKQRTVDRYAKGETESVPVGFLLDVLREYPQISRMWLMFGEGEVFRSCTPEPAPDARQADLESLRKENAALQSTVAELRDKIELLKGWNKSLQENNSLLRESHGAQAPEPAAPEEPTGLETFHPCKVSHGTLAAAAEEPRAYDAGKKQE